MPYRLYRVDAPGADCSGGSLLGEYDSFDAALDARDDDTAAMYASTEPGDSLLACHQIVDTEAGETSPCPVTSHLPRPESPDCSDVTEAREWLRRVHAACPRR